MNTSLTRSADPAASPPAIAAGGANCHPGPQPTGLEAAEAAAPIRSIGGRRRSAALVLAGWVAASVAAGCSGSSDGNRSAAPPPTPNPPPPVTGLIADETIRVGSADRKYDYYVPAGISGGSPPVVFLLHGGRQNRATLRETDDPFREWLDIAEEDGVLLIYPNAGNENANPDPVDGYWNDCRTGEDFESPLDDVAFVDALIDWAASEFNADVTRIYVAGPSNGGLMAYRLAEELGGRIAAFSAFVANTVVGSECAPLNIPVPALILAGTDDPFMPYDGGAILGENLGPNLGDVVSAADTVDYWTSYNGASAPLGTTAFDDLDSSDGSTVTLSAFDGVAQVAFYEVDGGGHVVPSIEFQISQASELISGEQNHDIEATREAWAFMRTKRRNP